MKYKTGVPVTIPVAGARYTHIQFRRFSGCPICNTHIAELRQKKAQLDAAGIHEVLLFHSSQEDVAAFHRDSLLTRSAIARNATTANSEWSHPGVLSVRPPSGLRWPVFCAATSGGR